jgi:hypothetical protein
VSGFSRTVTVRLEVDATHVVEKSCGAQFRVDIVVKHGVVRYK